MSLFVPGTSLTSSFGGGGGGGGGGAAGMSLGSLGSLASLGLNLGSAFASGNTGAIAGTGGGAALGALAGTFLFPGLGTLLGASLGSSIGGIFGIGGGDEGPDAGAQFAAQLHSRASSLNVTLSRATERARFADQFYPTLLGQAGFSKDAITSILKQNRADLKAMIPPSEDQVWSAGEAEAAGVAAREFSRSDVPDFEDIASTLTKPYDTTFVDYKAAHPMETSPEYQNALKLGERAQDRQFSALGLTNSGKALESRAFLLSDLSAKEDILQEARQQYGYSTEQTNNLQKRTNEGRIFQQSLASAGLQQQADLVGQQLDAQQNNVTQQIAGQQALQLGTMEYQSNLLDKQLTNNTLMGSLGFALNSYNADRLYNQNNRLIDVYSARGGGGSAGGINYGGTGLSLPSLTTNYTPSIPY